MNGDVVTKLEDMLTQLVKVVRPLALPRSRKGNISAQTTHTIGPQEYANLENEQEKQ